MPDSTAPQRTLESLTSSFHTVCLCCVEAQRPSSRRVQPMSHPPIPPILASVIACIAAAVPARGRATFLDLLLGVPATKSGQDPDAILPDRLSRGWSTYYWYLEQGRW